MSTLTMERPKVKIFRASSLYEALEGCQEQGYRALFMPELIDQRIKAPNDSDVWKYWFSTPSLRATGKTKAGSNVVVYAHTGNHFSNPENMRKEVEGRRLAN